MIFLSHNHKDKDIVEPIAINLANIFGKDKVFYDSWSIQPGDGIIDKMNAGLEESTYFFFFVSRNSLQSNMVRMEWQNALLKASSGKAKLIPVKIDECIMPTILLQTLYIDIYGAGMDIGVRQMIDLVNGSNTFKPEFVGFQNIRAYLNQDGQKVIVKIKAEKILEPISRYLILVENPKDEFTYKVTSDSMYNGGFNADIKLDNGVSCNAIMVSVERGTTPQFPVVVELEPNKGYQVKVLGVMRAVNSERFSSVPVIA